MVRKLNLAVCAACVAAAITAPGAEAALRSCKPIVNPYAGTRFEGSNLHHIRARHATCPGARRVVKGAHRMALGMTPTLSGIRRFTWRGWRVLGDIRGSEDRYLAVKGHRRVRWRF